MKVILPCGDTLQTSPKSSLGELKKWIESNTGYSQYIQLLFRDNSELPLRDYETLEDGTYYVLMGNQVIPNDKILRDLVKQWLSGNKEEIIHIYGSIEEWNVSQITDMSYLFNTTTKRTSVYFNQYIGKWDVSNVENMEGMFKNNVVFNQNISDWDVRNVKNMQGMFSNCFMFNQNISKWKVGNVQTMKQMFLNASKFNQDISSWDVSNVKNMHQMFSNASKFNQPIGCWDISNVIDMRYMFYNASSFNINHIHWNMILDPHFAFGTNSL